MTVEIRVPTLGESVTEATIARWLKKPGEAVARDEPVVEVETDKVSLEIPAPAAGRLAEILVEEGADVEVGTVIGRIEEGAAAEAPPAAPAAEEAPPAEEAPAAAAASVKAGPAVRKHAAEKGIDLATVAATGPKGTVTKADVDAAVAQMSPAPEAPPAATPSPAPVAGGRREERVRMTRLRKRIAERLKEAQNTAAMLTTFNECDMSAVMALRQRYRDSFEKKHGIRLGFMSFFVKACVEALRQYPQVNAEIDGDEIVYKHYYDIGVAVSTDQGLVVPVLRDADLMSLADIEKAIADLGRRAREGRLSMEELTGGTFTITNGGVFGSLLSTPILNPPQSGILGMHKIQQRPMVTESGAIEARPMMYLALSYDHRLIDGREAVSFLVRVKECIEDPQRLLLEI
ncbi:MAG TPA: 2-oxoglutarate dehydrogenase complex dihydrolipoyllysine-residue succinyltransferase [Rhodospirillales bacterium]|nr:2-oxoglutarate dehydrogenase complex dihydrolipoyllysine-residue succinyltransferase [Rhodospirillales bacterium]